MIWGRPFCFLFVKQKKDRPSTPASESRSSFVITDWIYLIVTAFADNKKGGIIPLEINPTLCIKPLSPKGTSIKPKNTYIIQAKHLFVNTLKFLDYSEQK
jgi:hypothetical protein